MSMMMMIESHHHDKDIDRIMNVPIGKIIILNTHTNNYTVENEDVWFEHQPDLIGETAMVPYYTSTKTSHCYEQIIEGNNEEGEEGETTSINKTPKKKKIISFNSLCGYFLSRFGDTENNQKVLLMMLQRLHTAHKEDIAENFEIIEIVIKKILHKSMQNTMTRNSGRQKSKLTKSKIKQFMIVCDRLMTSKIIV